VMAELRPPVLDDYGLLAALRWHGRRFMEYTGIATAVTGVEPTPRLPLATEMALFRIAQEALTNAAKHAHASQVKVTLEAVERGAWLTIADDGVGFDPASQGRPAEAASDTRFAGRVTDGRPGWGLLTMRERAEMIGGHLHVEATSGQGTRVIVEVPR